MLKCQYDIALPILDKYNLKAFWFIYTGPLKKEFTLGNAGKKININAIKVRHGLIDSVAYIINKVITLELKY